MKLRFLALPLALALSASAADKLPKGWYSLFDGKTFDGWKVNENNDTFTIRDGSIVANGPRSHCFYEGKVKNHDFKNFELMVDVMTKPGSNGGIYFHTAYQEKGFPDKGFEIQVNNSHTDRKRTGGIYNVKDVMDTSPAKDNEWFTEDILVQGKTVTVKVDGKIVAEWTQPEDWKGAKDMPGRVLGSGTIALQGHDPKSTVYYKNIRIKPLK